MGFLDSSAKIYNKMQFGGQALHMVENDIINKLKGINNAGYVWDATKSKLAIPNSFSGMQTETPWVHTAVQNNKRCGLDHQLIFNNFNIIPQKCMTCWKICCTIPDFHHLMKMKKMQQNFFLTSSKCGIEIRDYTPKHYGAYFYTGSFDEGRDVYKVVKEQIEDEVGPDVGVILKRACTEFEMERGPSPSWYLSPYDEDTIETIEKFVDHTSGNVRQDEIVKNHVVLKWILWAHSNGDFSYLPYNDNMKLWPDYVAYHEGNRDDVKKDIAMMRANAKHGVQLDVSKKLLALNAQFATDNNIPQDTVLDMATDGANTIRLSETPKHLVGEHDELT